MRPSAFCVGLAVLGIAPFLHADVPRAAAPLVQASPIRVTLGTTSGDTRAVPRQTVAHAPPPPVLDQPLHTEAINAARTAASLPPLSPGVSATLLGAVVFTPASPTVGNDRLGWSSGAAMDFWNDRDTGGVDLPLPVTDSPWNEAHVFIAADFVVNKLYLLDCRVVANNNHVPTIMFSFNGGGVWTSTDPDPKTQHSFWAFRASQARALLNITARRKPNEASQRGDALTFYGCTLWPAE